MKGGEDDQSGRRIAYGEIDGVLDRIVVGVGGMGAGRSDFHLEKIRETIVVEIGLDRGFEAVDTRNVIVSQPDEEFRRGRCNAPAL